MELFYSQALVEDLIFPECPRWRNGKLWFSNIFADQLISIFTNGKYDTIYNVPSVGFDWLPDGSLVYIERSSTKRRVMRYTEGKTEVYCDLSEMIQFQFNDLTVDSKGNIYIGNTGNKMDDLNQIDKTVTAPLVLITHDKKNKVVAENLSFPNGIAISADNNRLVVAETYASRLIAFDIQSDGTLSNRKTFAEFDNGFQPDGIFFDSQGGIWAGIAKANCCLRINEGGEITHKVSTIGDRCPACMMGDDNSLYLCTRGMTNPNPNKELSKSGRIEMVRGTFYPKAGYP
jgi:sugar lactone lactonase YvrE